MKKVVINKCYGGFSLSPEALLWMYKRGAKELATPVDECYPPKNEDSMRYKKHALKIWKEYQRSPKEKIDSMFVVTFTPDMKFVLSGGREVERHNPLLVECVKKLGKKANGGCAELKIVDIPDNAEYSIEEYDGMEHIAEKHRTWG
jgi:hypothetical protein